MSNVRPVGVEVANLVRQTFEHVHSPRSGQVLRSEPGRSRMDPSVSSDTTYVSDTVRVGDATVRLSDEVLPGPRFRLVSTGWLRRRARSAAVQRIWFEEVVISSDKAYVRYTDSTSDSEFPICGHSAVFARAASGEWQFVETGDVRCAVV